MTASIKSEIPDWTRRWPAIAGALATLLGAAVLVARARGVPLLTSLADEVVLPTRIALGFATLGGALFLAATAENRVIRHGRWPLELAALALGALGIVELGTGTQLGLNGLLGATTLAATPASLLASVVVTLSALALLTERLDS